MDYQIGDRVLIKIAFVDGFLRQGTVYSVSRSRWAYHILPDGETSGGAYAADELAPASLTLDDQYEEVAKNGR